MKEWNIHNGVLKFDEETHSYWFNDVKCVSVTQVLHKLNPSKYKDIDPEVLKKAATRGSEIHNAIEIYETLGLENNDLQEFRNYKFLRKYYMFDVLEVEQPVVIEYKGHFFCGRYDGVLAEPLPPEEIKRENQIANRICLYDIKTTATLDKEYLSMQLSLYKYGCKQTYPSKKITGLRAIHLKKDRRRYEIIEEMDAEMILDRYFEILEEENESI